MTEDRVSPLNDRIGIIYRASVDQEIESALEDLQAVRTATAEFTAYIGGNVGLSPEQIRQRVREAPNLLQLIVQTRDAARRVNPKQHSKRMNPSGPRKTPHRLGPPLLVPLGPKPDPKAYKIFKSQIIFSDAGVFVKTTPLRTMDGLVIAWLRVLFERGPKNMVSSWEVIKDTFKQQVDESLVLPEVTVPNRKQKLVIKIDGRQETFSYLSFERCYRAARQPEKTLKQLL